MADEARRRIGEPGPAVIATPGKSEEEPGVTLIVLHSGRDTKELRMSMTCGHGVMAPRQARTTTCVVVSATGEDPVSTRSTPRKDPVVRLLARRPTGQRACSLLNPSPTTS